MPHIKHPRRTFLISPFAVVRYLHHGTRHPRTWSRPTLNPQIVRFTNDEIRFAPQERCAVSFHYTPGPTCFTQYHVLLALTVTLYRIASWKNLLMYTVAGLLFVVPEKKAR